MKNKHEENLCQGHLTDQKLLQFLEHCDANLAEECRQEGCVRCGGRLHRANFRRKPRGGVEAEGEVYRYSFCCDRDGCRKRHTAASVRFLGRRVYWGFVVVLVSAMRHGLTPGRMRTIRENLGVDRRTLERWREWWLEHFVQRGFWKAARARFMPSLCESTLPLSLCESFEAGTRGGLLKLLEFLLPLTGSSHLERQVM